MRQVPATAFHGYSQACGFTLLELLAVVVISALLLTAVLGAMRASMTVREKHHAAALDAAARQRCLNIMAADLCAMVPPATTLTGNVLGEQDGDTDLRRDTLQFACSANSPRSGVEGADVIQVAYSVEEDDDQEDVSQLVRSATPNPLATDTSDPTETVLLSGIATLAFAYFDGEDWQDSWDASLRSNELPRAVRVNIELTAENDEDDHVPLPDLIVPVLCETEESEQGGASE